MKILTWNCNMAFRKKIQHIAKFDADILVVQECENRDFDCSPYVRECWIGDSPHKGLAVFAKPHVSITALPNDTECKWVIPLQCTCEAESFLLLAVWTKDNKHREKSYIGQLMHALRDYEELLRGQTCVIIGDFNSNKLWDKTRKNNHTAMTALLSDHNIFSAYHYFYREVQGEETRPTYYLYKKADKPYHLDYCYISGEFLPKLTQVMVGSYDDWIQWSDHCPIFINIES